MTNRLITIGLAVSSLSAVFPVVARAQTPALAAQPFGFYGGAGEVQVALLAMDFSGRYFSGITTDVETSAVQYWGVDTATGSTHPLGLFDDGVHTANAIVFGIAPSTSGLFVGAAIRDGEETVAPSLFGTSSVSAWVADLNTGVTRQVGLYDTAHSLANSVLDSTGPAYVNLAITDNGAGQVMGLAVHNSDSAGRVIVDSVFDGFPPIADPMGQSVWMADAYTGVTTRFGLTDAAHTMPVLEVGVPEEGEEAENPPGGYQFSTFANGGINAEGLLAGGSLRFGNVEGSGADQIVYAGFSLWVGDANTGKTYVVGLTDAAHTSADGTRDGNFVDLIPLGFSDTLPSLVTSEGFVAGTSDNYTASGDIGASAWVAKYDADTDAYITTRIGFFGADAGGRYQDATGFEVSEATHFTETGLIGGSSEMLDDPLYTGMQSAWVVDAHTLIRTEVGLLDATHTLDDGYRQTALVELTNAGLLAGQATNFESGNIDAWVQKVATSIDGTTMAVQEIGLDAVIGSISRDNLISYATDSGIVDGETNQNLESGAYLQDVWVAYKNGAGYTTNQVGLIGGAYENPETGDRQSVVEYVFENGLTVGTSDRYNLADTVVESAPATWIATRQPAQNYVTTRVGLHDAFHTNVNGQQSSAFEEFAATESGYIGGYSTHYGTGGAEGQSAWIVDASDAITRQVGATNSRHTDVNGVRYSEIEGVTESGFGWGNSTRYTDDGLAMNGETAWVYAFSDHSLHLMELSTDLVGYADSYINGVREDGLAYGAFEQFDATTGESLGYRAFGWTLAGGTFLIGDVIVNDTSEFNWGELLDVYFVTDDGLFVGLTESGHLFGATLVPEPSTTAMFAGLAMLSFVIVRRRRRG